MTPSGAEPATPSTTEPATADTEPATADTEAATRTVARARRLHPVTPVFDLLTGARRSWPIVLALVFGRADVTQVAVAAALFLVLGGQVVRWWRTTYALTPDALRFDEGLLSRRHRTVPYDRVQQVSVVRQLRHRMLGVARLQVETAGGRGTEIALDVLSLAEAERLRSMLGRAPATATASVAGARADQKVAPPTDGAEGSARRAPAPDGEPDVPAPPPPPPAATTLVRLPFGEVVLAGVTGAKLLVVLGAGAAMLNLVDDLPGRVLPDPGDVQLPVLDALAAGGLVLAAVIAWFALAGAASVFSDFGFTLARRGDRFVVERGLLEKRELAVPVHRVQVVTVNETMLRRLLHRAAVRVQSAAGTFVVPLVGAAQAIGLVHDLTGVDRLPEVDPAPPAARRRLIMRRVAPAGAFALAAAVVLAPADARPWSLAAALAVVIVPLAAAAGWAAWRALGHGADARVVVARNGALYRTLVVVPTQKAQSTRVTSTPFQRRVGLATLHVDVAGGAPARVPEIYMERAVALGAGLVAPDPARRADDRALRRPTATGSSSGASVPGTTISG